MALQALIIVSGPINSIKSTIELVSKIQTMMVPVSQVWLLMASRCFLAKMATCKVFGWMEIKITAMKITWEQIKLRFKTDKECFKIDSSVNLGIWPQIETIEKLYHLIAMYKILMTELLTQIILKINDYSVFMSK